MTLSTVQVLLDNGTGTFPYDITSKCLLADGFRFDRGRQDEQGGVTAGSLSLTLNNADGRFTPGSTIIASPSPIKVDQRIRLKETVNGTTFTRFTGYVKQWPVSWPATVSTFATVQLVATDAQARAERRVLRSVVEQEIAADLPSAYYTLSDPAGAVTAADSSGNQAPSLMQTGAGSAVTFGASGPTTGSSTTASFAAGFGLRTVSVSLSSTPAFLFAFSTTSTSPGVVFAVDPDGNNAFQLRLSAIGALTLNATAVGSGAYNDGAFHVIALRMTAATTADVYIDGVLTNSGVNTGASAAGTQLVLGGALGGTAGTFVGSIAHFAFWNTAPTGARLIAHSRAILTGFAGESGTARLTRLAGYANLPLGTLDTSLTNVAFTDITGRSAWDALQQVTDAEGGVSFFDGSGNLIFHNRNRGPAKTTPDLTLAATYITPDVQPVDDDQQIINYLEVTAEGSGNGAQVARNTVSELGDGTATHPGHGRYPASASYLVQTDAEALDRANWTLSNFAEPTTRYGTLTANLYAMSAAQAAATLAAVEVDCWLRVTGAPSQNTGGTQIDVVVEGYTETQSASEWKLTCNVVSQYLFDAFVLDTSLLDSTDRLYV